MNNKKPKKEKPYIPIKDKLNLTVEEAAVYSGISERRLKERIAECDFDFVLRNGTRILIKRKKFEKYLESVDCI